LHQDYLTMLDLEISEREYLYKKLVDTKKKEAEEIKKRLQK